MFTDWFLCAFIVQPLCRETRSRGGCVNRLISPSMKTKDFLLIFVWRRQTVGRWTQTEETLPEFKIKKEFADISVISALNLSSWPLSWLPNRHVTFKHLLTWAWAACFTDDVEVLSSMFASLNLKPIAKATCKQSEYSGWMMCSWLQQEAGLTVMGEPHFMNHWSVVHRLVEFLLSDEMLHIMSGKLRYFTVCYYFLLGAQWLHTCPLLVCMLVYFIGLKYSFRTLEPNYW